MVSTSSMRPCKSHVLISCLLLISAPTLAGARRASESEWSSSVANKSNTEIMDSFVDQIHLGADALGRPGVKFDENWFDQKCVKDDVAPLFMSSKFQLSENVKEDENKWERSMKCEDKGDGREAEIIEEIKTNRACAELCSAASAKHAGQVVCCEFFSDKDRCEIRVGWQSLENSNWGTNNWNALNWFRDPKFARLFFTRGSEGDEIPLMEGEEMQRADEGREKMKDLITQVNHMSIDGILDHLLSFYICLRWVPDEEFMNLASFEMTHVSVDQMTPSIPKVSREELIEHYLTGKLMPLRCGTAMHVQDVPSITKLIESLKKKDSPLNDAARFSEKVAYEGTGLITKMQNRIQSVEDAMYHKGQGDSVFVKDMNRKVRSDFPWNTFLRPSKQFSPHVSSPENEFILCFGPRVASYPHKRQDGGHVLADMNMAGCNGLWDVPTITDHMERIKKLFAPEMCFEFTLRKELKQQFMHTFVQMNEEFEKAMAGQYTKRVHDLDPTKSKKLDLLKGATVQIGDIGADLSSRAANSKYTSFAGMVAKAHSKWVVCEAQDAETPEGSKPFGQEDNFFRDPKSYEKWLGKLSDDTVPECKTLDDTTGCVKCAIAVKDKHGCHVRLNVHLPDIYRAIKDRKYPFLKSDYLVQEEVQTDQGPQLQTVRKQGACLVRKSPTSVHKAKAKGLKAIEEAFFHVSNDDTVVMLGPEAASGAKSGYRYIMEERKKELEAFIENPVLPDLEVEALVNAIAEEEYRDSTDDFSKKFIFTDDIPEESNVQEHKVDYFVSCPCSKKDFGPTEHFENVGSQGMAEYWNR